MRATEDVESEGRQPGYQQMPTKELLSSLFEQGKVLLQEEVRLAKEELRAEAKQAGTSAGVVGGGAVLLHIGALVFAGFLVAVLDLFLPLWAAALVVAALLIGVGAVLARGGINKLKKTNLRPEETLQTLKEDKEWLRRTMHAGTSQRRVTA